MGLVLFCRGFLKTDEAPEVDFNFSNTHFAVLHCLLNLGFLLSTNLVLTYPSSVFQEEKNALITCKHIYVWGPWGRQREATVIGSLWVSYRPAHLN